MKGNPETTVIYELGPMDHTIALYPRYFHNLLTTVL